MSAGAEGRLALRQLAILIAVSAVLLFFDFGTRVYTTNDETRFPLMARDILRHGHWLQPEINGTPMLNKPPLHAWLIAIAAWPAGAVTPRTAQLPSLLAALALVAVTYWIGARLFSPGAGVAAGLIVVTTAGVFSLARSPIPDMVLSLVVALAIVAFVMAEFDGRPRALLAFYVLVGVAFWVKGPAGFLPLGVALVYELIAYGWTGPRRLVSPIGIGLLTVCVAVWGWMASTTGGASFVEEVLTQDFVLAYFVSGPWGQGGLLHAFGQALSILLPWTILIPVALWSSIRPGDAVRRRETYLVMAWMAAVFVLVAVSHRQRWRYYLPLCTPAALLVAVWLAKLQWRWRTQAFVASWLVVATALVAGQVTMMTRQARSTDWRKIAAEATKARGSLFALGAPEIVFEFYLDTPVLVATDYATFARRPEATDLLIPTRKLQDLPQRSELWEVADGKVAGQGFALLRKTNETPRSTD
jgi:4-amino-4-deoxy-L-arabinose transferase-like glycosyltransferase